jgi:hypothetical protein
MQHFLIEKGVTAIHSVMAGLVPAIHVFAAALSQDVDARHKAGHDEA